MKYNQKTLVSIFLSLTFISTLFIIGCKQTDELIPEASPKNKTIPLSIESGILVFKNWNDFNKMVDSLGHLSLRKRRLWETSHDFFSRASVFEDILDAEETNELEYYQDYLDQGYTESEIPLLGIPKPPHSELYQKAKRNHDILIFEDSDTASTYSVNSPMPYAPVLSAEGFVIVGDTLSLLLRGSIRHWIGGQIEKRHALQRVTQSDVSAGILVGNLPEYGSKRSNSYWGTATFFYRWVYEAGSNPKRRAAYELRGWSTDYSVSNPTQIHVEHWFELYAEKKSFGVWAARNSYRPNFHLAGFWVHFFGIDDPHGCAGNYSVYSNWSNNNDSHSEDFLSPIVDEIVPADNYAWQYEMLYPHGTFQLNDGFCELFRVIQMDVNVHAVGDGAGTLDLVRHLYAE